MKTKRVATQYAGKSKGVFPGTKYKGAGLWLCIWFLILSCEKSDDLETIVKEPRIVKESPQDHEPRPEEVSKIIYTDYEPDFNNAKPEDSYGLDLNNDQIIDFTISLLSDSGGQFLLIASNPIANNGIMSITPWYTYCIPLSLEKEIFNLSGTGRGEFYTSTSIISSEDCFETENSDDCRYDWAGKNDKYIGLRLNRGGNAQSYYGWARLNVTSPTQWVIKDYAYNTTPDMPIHAGQRD